MLQTDEPTASGWLKVRRYAEVPEQDEHLPLRLDYGRSPHAYVKQRLQIQLELLMMSGVPLEIC